jgi:hypothetical protein
LRQLIENLSECINLPGLVLIVDSSEAPLGDDVLLELQSKLGVRLGYALSDSGLPFQRNVGMDEITRETFEGSIEICHFLDDDVVINREYFSTVSRIFHDSKPVALGAFDLNLPSNRYTSTRRIFGLVGSRNGELLKSGIAIAPAGVSERAEVDWLPGHSVAYRWPLVQQVGFNSRLRMYGEDVELCLRLREHGHLEVHPEVFVRHYPDKAGRDTRTKVQAFSSGFRWRLATDYPGMVSKRWVLISTAALLAGGLLSEIFGRPSRSVWQGQLLFIWRLLCRMEPEQLIDRPEIATLPRTVRILNQKLFVSVRQFSGEETAGSLS